MQSSGHADLTDLIGGLVSVNHRLTRLAATGFGEYQPITAGTSPEDLALNRRIELKHPAVGKLQDGHCGQQFAARTDAIQGVGRDRCLGRVAHIAQRLGPINTFVGNECHGNGRGFRVFQGFPDQRGGQTMAFCEWGRCCARGGGCVPGRRQYRTGPSSCCSGSGQPQSGQHAAS